MIPAEPVGDLGDHGNMSVNPASESSIINSNSVAAQDSSKAKTSSIWSATAPTPSQETPSPMSKVSVPAASPIQTVNTPSQPVWSITSPSAPAPAPIRPPVENALPVDAGDSFGNAGSSPAPAEARTLFGFTPDQFISMYGQRAYESLPDVWKPGNYTPGGAAYADYLPSGDSVDWSQAGLGGFVEATPGGNTAIPLDRLSAGQQAAYLRDFGLYSQSAEADELRREAEASNRYYDYNTPGSEYDMKSAADSTDAAVRTVMWGYGTGKNVETAVIKPDSRVYSGSPSGSAIPVIGDNGQVLDTIVYDPVAGKFLTSMFNFAGSEPAANVVDPYRSNPQDSWFWGKRYGNGNDIINLDTLPTVHTYGDLGVGNVAAQIAAGSKSTGPWSLAGSGSRGLSPAALGDLGVSAVAASMSGNPFTSSGNGISPLLPNGLLVGVNTKNNGDNFEIDSTYMKNMFSPSKATNAPILDSSDNGINLFGLNIPMPGFAGISRNSSIGSSLNGLKTTRQSVANWANSPSVSPYISTGGLIVGLTDNPAGSPQSIDNFVSGAGAKIFGGRSVFNPENAYSFGKITPPASSSSSDLDKVILRPVNDVESDEIPAKLVGISDEWAPGEALRNVRLTPDMSLVDTGFLRSGTDQPLIMTPGEYASTKAAAQRGILDYYAGTEPGPSIPFDLTNVPYRGVRAGVPSDIGELNAGNRLIDIEGMPDIRIDTGMGDAMPTRAGARAGARDNVLSFDLTGRNAPEFEDVPGIGGNRGLGGINIMTRKPTESLFTPLESIRAEGSEKLLAPYNFDLYDTSTKESEAIKDFLGFRPESELKGFNTLAERRLDYNVGKFGATRFDIEKARTENPYSLNFDTFSLKPSRTTTVNLNHRLTGVGVSTGVSSLKLGMRMRSNSLGGMIGGSGSPQKRSQSSSNDFKLSMTPMLGSGSSTDLGTITAQIDRSIVGTTPTQKSTISSLVDTTYDYGVSKISNPKNTFSWPTGGNGGGNENSNPKPNDIPFGIPLPWLNFGGDNTNAARKRRRFAWTYKNNLAIFNPFGGNAFGLPNSAASKGGASGFPMMFNDLNFSSLGGGKSMKRTSKEPSFGDMMGSLGGLSFDFSGFGSMGGRKNKKFRLNF